MNDCNNSSYINYNENADTSHNCITDIVIDDVNVVYDVTSVLNIDNSLIYIRDDFERFKMTLRDDYGDGWTSSKIIFDFIPVDEFNNDYDGTSNGRFSITISNGEGTIKTFFLLIKKGKYNIIVTKENTYPTDNSWILESMYVDITNSNLVYNTIKTSETPYNDYEINDFVVLEKNKLLDEIITENNWLTYDNVLNSGYTMEYLSARSLNSSTGINLQLFYDNNVPVQNKSTYNFSLSYLCDENYGINTNLGLIDLKEGGYKFYDYIIFWKIDKTNLSTIMNYIKGNGFSLKDLFDYLNDPGLENNYDNKKYWLDNIINYIPSVQQLYSIGYSVYELKIGYFTIHDVWSVWPKPALDDLVKNYALIDIMSYTTYTSLTYILRNLPKEKLVYNVTGLNLDVSEIPNQYEIIGYRLIDTFGDGWQGAEVYFNSVNKNVDENGVVTYTNDADDDIPYNDQLFIPDKEDNYAPLDINYSYGAMNYYPFFTDSEYPIPQGQVMNITGLLMIRRGTYNVLSSRDFNNYNNEVQWNIIGQDGNIIVPEQVEGAPTYEGVEFSGYMTIEKGGCTNPDAVNYDATAEVNNGSCFIEGYEVNNPDGIGILRLDLRNGGSVIGYEVV